MSHPFYVNENENKCYHIRLTKKNWLIIIIVSPVCTRDPFEMGFSYYQKCQNPKCNEFYSVILNFKLFVCQKVLNHRTNLNYSFSTYAVFRTTYECVNWIVSSLCWRYGSVQSSKPSDLFGWSVSHIMGSYSPLCFKHKLEERKPKKNEGTQFWMRWNAHIHRIVVIDNKGGKWMHWVVVSFRSASSFYFFFFSGWRETNSINGAYEMRYVWYDRCEVWGMM